MSTVQPITGRQVGEFCRLLEERGVDKDEFQARFTQGINDVVDWLRDVQQSYPITVDYNQTLRQMIAAGKYNDVGSNSQYFPVKGEGIVDLDTRLIRFSESVSYDTVITHLDKMGFRPATFAELLAFGAKYPNLQRKFRIVALGSVIGGDAGSHGVAFLDFTLDFNRKRHLWIHFFISGEFGPCRFLAVRK